MASIVNNMKIEWKTRLCRVDDRIGYFHTWEQYSEIIPPSILKGGHSGGQISEVFGIVEFEDGIERIRAHKIAFCDEIHAELVGFIKHIKELEEGERKNENR